MVRQVPQSLRAAKKLGQRGQYAALCYRIRRGKPEILLITSRGTKRWIVPKGWPIENLVPGESAAQEAWEEAGVKGKAYERAVGLFTYNKVLDDGTTVPVAALVYPLKVKSLSKRYPEVGQRIRKWFSPGKAADRVTEPELARIIRDFDPRALR